MLIESNMFETVDKVSQAITRIKLYEPKDGYYVAFSGGKDSIVILDLVRKAGVKYTSHHNLTNVEPPELIYFIREYYPDVITERPKKTMWQLIEEHGMPPLRTARYCCGELKESDGIGKVVVTGVRWAESARRKEQSDVVKILGKPKTTETLAKKLGVNYRVTKQAGIVMNDDNDANRRMIEHCYRTQKTMINPIVDWTDDDVWEYIRANNLPYCKLYDNGWRRIGCMFCPMSTRAEKERQCVEYPKYKAAYIRAFDRMIAKRRKEGKQTSWKDGEQCFNWWLEIK